jgi:metal-responsive CopG/Arc/MetJ family transcriptional regulator
MRMAIVKTAVSIDKEVFEGAERLAQELQVSRSQLVTLALKRLVRAHENKALLERINASVDGMTGEDRAEEQAVLTHMKQRHHSQMLGEW